MKDLSNFHKVHFIAIGGIGMSALACILLGRGMQVRGSDNAASPITDKLERLGATVYIGHKAEQIKDAELIILSSAIKYENEELSKARELGLPVWHRSQLLAALMAEKEGIAVTGTHGKTTVSFMITSLLVQSGLDPAALLGGELPLIEGNSRWGNGDFLVAEADESDGSFLNLEAKYRVITNIEADHLDHYGNLENIEATFLKFINGLPSDGRAFLGSDSPSIKKLLPSVNCAYTTFGLEPEAEVRAQDITFEGQTSSFNLYFKDEFISEITLSVPGIYNIQNALAASAFLLHIGLKPKAIKEGFANFVQGKRRYELIDTVKGIKIVEDYAHHPQEVMSLLQAAKNEKKDRVIIVFQPHLYSRTLDFLDQFAQAFDRADLVVLTDIYPSRERMPDPPVRGTIVADAVKKHSNSIKVLYVEDKNDLPEVLAPLLKEGDLIIFAGAGDINIQGRKLAHKLSR